MSTETRDPWAAVQRIKLKHEKVVQAAITVVNCYYWQGEQREQFVAEAMKELQDALEVIKPRVGPVELETFELEVSGD